MEGFERVIAVVFTFIAIGVIAVAIMVLVASFLAQPVGTVLVLTATIWLFRKIYPHVIRFMEREGF